MNIPHLPLAFGLQHVPNGVDSHFRIRLAVAKRCGGTSWGAWADKGGCERNSAEPYQGREMSRMNHLKALTRPAFPAFETGCAFADERLECCAMNEQDRTNPNGNPKAMPLPPKRQTKPGKKTRPEKKRPFIASEDLPKNNLQDALTVARAIKDNYGTTGASWEQIASAMDTAPSNVSSKYLLWSATAYGIITKEGSNYTLSETGRKILAPTYEVEEREGIIKAIG